VRIEMKAEISAPLFLVEETVQVRLSIENRTPSVVSVPDPLLNDLTPEFIITDPHGKRTTVTHAATHPKITAMHDPEAPPSTERMDLAPRAKWSELIPLDPMLPLNEPGSYRVQVTYTVDQDRLLSPAMEFRIVSANVTAFAAAPPSYTHSLILDSLLSGNWSTFSDALRHLALPAITLAIVETAPILKITRSATLEVAGSDYVRTARAYGLSPREILENDILRNVATRVLTALGIVFGFLLGGSILVETIYDWPGIGLYAWNAVTTTDYNAIQGYTLLVGVVYVLLNLAVDLLYAAADPRIRLGSAGGGPARPPRLAWAGRRVISPPSAERR